LDWGLKTKGCSRDRGRDNCAPKGRPLRLIDPLPLTAAPPASVPLRSRRPTLAQHSQLVADGFCKELDYARPGTGDRLGIYTLSSGRVSVVADVGLGSGQVTFAAPGLGTLEFIGSNAYAYRAEDLRGFWLIRPDGSLSHSGKYLKALLEHAGETLPKQSWHSA
jgi:hypothetical protein